MVLIHKIFAVAAVAMFAVLGLCACSSGPQPSNWSETRWREPMEDIDRAIRGILQQRFGYQVVDYEKGDAGDGPFVKFTTEWNYRQAQGAVFSGTGVRRMAWVELHELYTAQDAPATKDDEPFKDPVEDKAPEAGGTTTTKVRVVVRDGKKMLAYVIVGIAVETERNMSILNPGSIEKGEWRDNGPDKSQVEHIIAELRWRLREMGGKEFDISEKGRKVHEKGLNPGDLTDERREDMHKDLRGDGDK